MPRALVYWCAIRLMTHATFGRYSSQVVPELTAFEALKRWNDKYNPLDVPFNNQPHFLSRHVSQEELKSLSTEVAQSATPVSNRLFRIPNF
jgi:hypothetical protein